MAAGVDRFGGLKMDEVLTITFNQKIGGTVKGRHGHKIVSHWGYNPEPQFGETWKCRVNSDYGSGIQVIPFEKVS